MIQKVKITDIFSNPNNPRLIKKEKFDKLVKSIEEFPEMLKLRPIVVNSDMHILGGNMRFKACEQLGLKEVYIIKAENLTDKQLQQFVIIDNVGFGEWDWDILANAWDTKELKDWGMDVWQNNTENVDYINNGDENSEWVDMPDFEKGDGYIQCNIIFATETEREDYINKNLIQYKIINRNKQKIVYFGTEAK